MREASRLAWESAHELDESGLSAYQIATESIIEARLQSADMRLTDRAVEGEDRKCIVAGVSDMGLRVKIHRDHLEVTNEATGEPAFCMEWDDDMVPEDHYSAADEFFRDRVAIHRRTA